MIAVLMGVTGSGKSTIAEEIVKLTGWEFAEGDSFHNEANRAKMHAGIPLTDEDREPWLASLHDVLAGWVWDGKSGVMTCSALKTKYRETLEGNLPNGTVRFVLLDVPKAVLQDRLAHRKGHYMNPALLDSQLATLEQPGAGALHIEATAAPEQVAQAVLDGLKAAQ